MSETRVGLSLKFGILAGIIWGLFFTAYYEMLQNAKFAYISASVCFVAMVIFFLSWPLLIKAFKNASKERAEELENQEEDDNEK